MMIDIDSDMLLSSALNVFKFQLHPYLVTFILHYFHLVVDYIIILR